MPGNFPDTPTQLCLQFPLLGPIPSGCYSACTVGNWRPWPAAPRHYNTPTHIGRAQARLVRSSFVSPYRSAFAARLCYCKHEAKVAKTTCGKSPCPFPPSRTEITENSIGPAGFAFALTVEAAGGGLSNLNPDLIRS